MVQRPDVDRRTTANAHNLLQIWVWHVPRACLAHAEADHCDDEDPDVETHNKQHQEEGGEDDDQLEATNEESCDKRDFYRNLSEALLFAANVN